MVSMVLVGIDFIFRTISLGFLKARKHLEFIDAFLDGDVFFSKGSIWSSLTPSSMVSNMKLG